MAWERPKLRTEYTLEHCYSCTHFHRVESNEGGYYPVCDRIGDLHDFNLCRLSEYGRA